MTIRHAHALLIPLVFLAAPQALAQGTEAQRSACMPDVFRLCASAVPNVGAIKACLAREQARLSPACRTVMDEAGATARQAEAPPARPEGATERPARAAERPARVTERRERLTVRRDAPVARPTAPRRVARAAPAPVCACSARAALRAPRPTPRYAAIPHRYRTAARRPRGYGAEMEQAMYWMRTLSGLSGSMGGLSLGSLAGLMP